jgi:hypothetical protein
MLNIEPSTMQIKRSFREFKVGDKIFWKVTHEGSSLTSGKSKKLSPTFCNSFDIVRMIGPISYELKMLENYKIHNFFYVCLSSFLW